MSMSEDGAHQGSAQVAASRADSTEKLVARRGVEQSNVLFGGQIGPATKALSAGTTAISVGDKAPEFSLPTTQGGTWSLGEHLAQHLCSTVALVRVLQHLPPRTAPNSSVAVGRQCCLDSGIA